MTNWCTASAPETLNELQAAVHLQSGKSYSFVSFVLFNCIQFSYCSFFFFPNRSNPWMACSEESEWHS